MDQLETGVQKVFDQSVRHPFQDCYHDFRDQRGGGGILKTAFCSATGQRIPSQVSLQVGRRGVVHTLGGRGVAQINPGDGAMKLVKFIPFESASFMLVLQDCHIPIIWWK